jgi:hypothetical protein
MADTKVTRRDFVRGSAVSTMGTALGLSPTYTVHAGNPDKDDTGKIWLRRSRADPQKNCRR